MPYCRRLLNRVKYGDKCVNDNIIVIIILIGALLYFVAPKIIDIYNDNVRQTNDRANKT